MQDFDVERSERTAVDRTFKIGGEVFVMKAAVRPETMIGYEAINEDTQPEDVLRIIDDLIVSFIEGGEDAAQRYRDVRAREDDAVSMRDLNALTDWMIGRQTGRPPTPPSSSMGGAETTQDSSTAGPALAAVT